MFYGGGRERGKSKAFMVDVGWERLGRKWEMGVTKANGMVVRPKAKHLQP